jgi:hypothetical protein
MPLLLGNSPNQVPTNGDLGDLAFQSAANIAGDVGIGGAVTATSGVITANTTTDALRITQTGTGNAFVVEDSASPDSTPFVIDAAGLVKLGTAVNVTPAALGEAPLQVAYVGSTSPLAVFRQGSNSSQGSELILEHARGATTNDILGSADNIGEIRMFGADGTNFIEAASIVAAVDGIPGLNDMPGRLVFSTTADGASLPTERMRIRSDGAVVVGANAGANINLKAGGAGTTGALNYTFNSDSTVYGSLALSYDTRTTVGLALTSASSYPITVNAGNGVIFKEDGVEKMRITSAGNVGIGTSNPAQKLHVASSTVTGVIQLGGQSTDGYYAQINQNGNQLQLIANGDQGFRASLGTNNGTGFMTFLTAGLTTGNTERMRIDSSGNVGIGTSSPGQRLQVNGPTVTQILYNTNALANDDSAASIKTTNGPLWNYLNLDASSYRFNTFGTERVRIDSSGNVGIGTSSPASKLDVIGTARATALLITNGDASITNGGAGDARPLFIENSSATGLPNGSLYISNVNNPNNTTYAFMQAVAGAVQKFVVFGNGTTQNGTGVYGTVSDARIKKDVVNTSPKLDKLLQVRVVNYTRTDDPSESRQIGVIAQELEEVFPGLIDVVEEKDKDGNVTCPDRKSVKYSLFVPMLIKAIQEQQSIIQSLTTRITALETK